jgi:hypothetical protein
MSQYKETLKFRIGLSGTFWNKVPLFSIRIDGIELIAGFVSTKETAYYQFAADLEEDKQHLLEIRLENKTDSDTVLSEDNKTIIKDMLLNIDSIEIDETELEGLKWSISEFVADDPNKPVLKNCINLGWNGSYKLEFSSPFYLWLLENM